MDQDILLITIDCWRTDSIQYMDNLDNIHRKMANFKQSNIICQSSATSGVTAGFLASRYPPQAYSEDGSVKQDVESFPGELRNNGYKTGAVIGSNPYPNLWSHDFDFFWNDGLSNHESDSSSLGRWRKSIYHDFNLHRLKYLLLRQKVSVNTVADIATDWYNDQTDPVFLWIHLNDIHEPYLPGLSSGTDVGLLRTYRAYIAHQKRRESMSEAMLNTHRELYHETVQQLDERLPRILDLVNDDATILLMGDHGQEFDHGIHMHARMYDEVVRVPFFVKWTLPGDFEFPDEPMRQIDIPPTILESLDISIPDSWEGYPINEEVDRPSFSIGHTPYLEKVFTALRKDGYKILKSFDDSTLAITEREFLDLDRDPHETNDLYCDDPRCEEYERELDAWIARDDIRLADLQTDPNSSTPHESSGDDENVTRRLKQLGYSE